MSRSLRASSLRVVPGWGMQSDDPLQNVALKGWVARSVGPVRVEFAGVVQSTWNFHTWRFPAPVSTAAK